MKWDELKVGDTVKFRNFGSSMLLTGTIVELDRGGKDGRPTIDIDLPNGVSKWCYLHQIDSQA